jgi:hypothetical protein
MGSYATELENETRWAAATHKYNKTVPLVKFIDFLPNPEFCGERNEI